MPDASYYNLFTENLASTESFALSHPRHFVIDLNTQQTLVGGLAGDWTRFLYIPIGTFSIIDMPSERILFFFSDMLCTTKLDCSSLHNDDSQLTWYCLDGWCAGAEVGSIGGGLEGHLFPNTGKPFTERPGGNWSLHMYIKLKLCIQWRCVINNKRYSFQTVDASTGTQPDWLKTKCHATDWQHLLMLSNWTCGTNKHGSKDTDINILNKFALQSCPNVLPLSTVKVYFVQGMTTAKAVSTDTAHAPMVT